MEKEPQPDSLSTVTVKPDYAPSEIYSAEPPPAYQKPKSSTVQIARIASVTLVVCSIILGSFWLASAYLAANASCVLHAQELELINEVAERSQHSPQPQPEALIQEEPMHTKRHTDTQLKDNAKNVKEIDNNNVDNDDSSDSDSDSSSSADSDEEEKTVQFRLPLQLDFDELAGALIDKNQRSKMNCIVEKKKAEEVVDHQPKQISLPFGVNLTTDPRLERISGERMVIICESGTMQRAQPPTPSAAQQPPHEDEPSSEDDSEDEEQDTVLIQPVMIPIPPQAFHTHMPQQQAPAQPPMRSMHPMETMRPPMPPAVMQIQIQPHMQPQPVERQQSDMPPNPIIQHIIQQIITQKIMEAQKARAEQMAQEQLQRQQQAEMESRMGQRQPPIPLPVEVLTQLNRLPNNDRVIVAVQEPDSSEESSSSSQQQDQQDQQQQEIHVAGEMRVIAAPPQENDSEVRVMPQMRPQMVQMVEQRQPNPEEMVANRQVYARGMPAGVVMQQQQEVRESNDQEENRPHYVQPRSISEAEGSAKSRVARSANPLLPEKRMKRCACDCAC